MWRNTDVLAFVEWLRLHNTTRTANAWKVGFYGLDLYSLYTSIEAVISYLDRVDPEAAKRARSRYACFEHFGEDTQAYGYAAGFNLTKSCEDEVVNQLRDLQQQMTNYARRDGRLAEDEFFYAEQNARLAYARLPEQFDAVIHFDETHAVEPLDRTSQWEAGEVPETYPTAL